MGRRAYREVHWPLHSQRNEGDPCQAEPQTRPPKRGEGERNQEGPPHWPPCDHKSMLHDDMHVWTCRNIVVLLLIYLVLIMFLDVEIWKSGLRVKLSRQSDAMSAQQAPSKALSATSMRRSAGASVLDSIISIVSSRFVLAGSSVVRMLKCRQLGLQYCTRAGHVTM